MLFNSIEFAVFLPVVFTAYWILPKKYQWVVLLISSYWFYMSWKIEYVMLILATTAVSFFAAIMMQNKQGQVKKLILFAAAAISIGILFFFKYFDFFNRSICDIIGLFTVRPDPFVLKLILPVGISFYTFQTISYVIDVYRGTSKAELHFGKYAAFISFFPQLVAGPIERTNNLMPQINKKHSFDYAKAIYGLKLMAWGYFKKLALADVMGVYTRAIFNNPQYYRGFSLVLAAVMFTIQIYCDFSGYSDIAIGTAKLFGIDLMCNFKSPYFSQSIREFWGRWHISLSTWFRDYVYIPLGGSRCSKLRHSVNLMVTFLVSGLWHGANTTYILWGGIHGLGQVIENYLLPKKSASKGLLRWFRVTLVFGFCTLALVFFASKSVHDAVYIISHLFDGISDFSGYIEKGFSIFDNYDAGLILSLILLFAYDYYSLKGDVISAISSRGKVIRWTVYVVFLLWIYFNVVPDNNSVFIYFQF